MITIEQLACVGRKNSGVTQWTTRPARPRMKLTWATLVQLT